MTFIKQSLREFQILTNSNRNRARNRLYPNMRNLLLYSHSSQLVSIYIPCSTNKSDLPLRKRRQQQSSVHNHTIKRTWMGSVNQKSLDNRLGIPLKYDSVKTHSVAQLNTLPSRKCLSRSRIRDIHHSVTQQNLHLSPGITGNQIHTLKVIHYKYVRGHACTYISREMLELLLVSFWGSSMLT